MIQPPLTGSPVSILLLEDDPLDAELCLRKLESSDLFFSIKSVGNADDFKLEVATNKYDIILGDYRMPNWTGLEAVRWLRASGYSIPFILVTGTLGDELAVECIKEGANDYVLKDKLERLPLLYYVLLMNPEFGPSATSRSRRCASLNCNMLPLLRTLLMAFFAVTRAAGF
jgi:CheY-like chemotaxis protein